MDIVKNEGLKIITITHPTVGVIASSENLIDITEKEISDTVEISEPGAGGGRVVSIKADNAKMISVEVQVGSIEEMQLRRAQRYPSIEFTLQWSDLSSIISPAGGTALRCIMKKDSENKRSAKTATFNIIALDYTAI